MTHLQSGVARPWRQRKDQSQRLARVHRIRRSTSRVPSSRIPETGGFGGYLVIQSYPTVKDAGKKTVLLLQNVELLEQLAPTRFTLDNVLHHLICEISHAISLFVRNPVWRLQSHI